MGSCFDPRAGVYRLLRDGGGACGLCGWVGATLPKTMEDGERESWSTPQMGALGGAGNGKSLAPTVPTWGPAGVAVCLWIGGLLAQALGG